VEVSVASARPDHIAVRGLRAHAHHGVYGFERERGQTFSVDAVLEVDTAPAAAGDDLERTVNYADLAKQLHGVLTGEPVDLLETLAQRLADVCLADPLVDAVEITVHKPEADLGVPFDDVTVTIRRERP
jgi:dihydroneopterin aldolase